MNQLRDDASQLITASCWLAAGWGANCELRARRHSPRAADFGLSAILGSQQSPQRSQPAVGPQPGLRSQLGVIGWLAARSSNQRTKHGSNKFRSR